MNYNYYPYRQTPLNLRGHFVSSIEEAKAANIDFDGNIFYFPDMANKCIYTKQINLDGTMQFNKYQLTEIQENQNDYISRQEFLKAIQDLRTDLTPVSARADNDLQF